MLRLILACLGRGGGEASGSWIYIYIYIHNKTPCSDHEDVRAVNYNCEVRKRKCLRKTPRKKRKLERKLFARMSRCMHVLNMKTFRTLIET